MPHATVPAGELATRLSRLRAAMQQMHPDWSTLLLENKVDLFYFTGTMQDGALLITPDCATYFVRRSFECAKLESAFSDIRPMKSFRTISEAYTDLPATFHVAARTLTLQKLSLLQKYLPIEKTVPADGVLAALRAVKSEYELDCMRHSGAMHAHVLEQLTPALLRAGISEAELCGEICTALLREGAMGIARFNQPMAEDIFGVCSFGTNGLCPAALDSPSGTVGTSVAMKSIGSSVRLLQRDEAVLVDVPSGFRGYHTDKTICFFFGSLNRHPDGARIRAAHEQCIFLEQQAAALMTAGAVPSEIYEKVLALVDPAFAQGFMNGARFLGHSIGLTMDETPVLAAGFSQPLVAGQTLALEPKIALDGIGLIGSENTYEIVAHGAARPLTGTCSTRFEIFD